MTLGPGNPGCRGGVLMFPPFIALQRLIRARPLNHRLYDDCQYSKLLKSYTLPNEVSGGFKLHNAKTPVMRYVHQPGFPENPREVRDFAAPPGSNRGVTAYSSLPKYWRGDNENWFVLNSSRLNDNQNSRHSRALDRSGLPVLLISVLF